MAEPREWWTAAEIAEAELPDLPGTKRRVNAMAERLGWQGDPKRARRRKGRGGGWEYHKSLFPMRAQKALLPDTAKVPDRPGRDEAWQWFEALPDAVKSRAVERLAVIQQVETLEPCTGKFLAVEEVAKLRGVSPRTIWNWFGMIEGIAAEDRLPYLAPRNRAAKRKTGHAVDTRFMELIKADYLRLEGPALTACFERCAEIAEAKGIPVTPLHSVRRWIKANIQRVTIVYARQGETGLAKCFPPQVRDRSGMAAMEGVNADCHKWDVFVLWPDSVKPERAQLVAFQDIFSGKILSWRIDRAPNKVAVMAAFGEMVEEYGIPAHVLFDNGMEFANKWLTGGAKTRFRFKIRQDDPLGVLSLLGITIHWAQPAHGQAKPVERSFRDMCDRIAKDPRFEGAWVGNRPDAKPENYASKAIPIEQFTRVVAEGIARHNARLGRQSPTCNGRSFDETFAESYAGTKVRKVTDEQRRLWLMAQEVRRLHRDHGRVTLARNVYWSAWMNEHAGEKVVLRFDPEDLHSGLHVYRLDGEYLGFAACEQKVGFFDMSGARDHARRKTAIRKTEKKLLEQHRTMKVAEVAALMDELTPAPVEPIEARIIEMVPAESRPAAARVTRPVHEDRMSEGARAELLDFRERYEAERAAEAVPADPWGNSPRERFRYALDLEAELASGRPIDPADRQRLHGYQQSAEYRGERALYDGGFGDGMFLK